jgi:hypothetical protein
MATPVKARPGPITSSDYSPVSEHSHGGGPASPHSDHDRSPLIDADGDDDGTQGRGAVLNSCPPPLELEVSEFSMRVRRALLVEVLHGYCVRLCLCGSLWFTTTFKVLRSHQLSFIDSLSHTRALTRFRTWKPPPNVHTQDVTAMSVAPAVTRVPPASETGVHIGGVGGTKGDWQPYGRTLQECPPLAWLIRNLTGEEESGSVTRTLIGWRWWFASPLQYDIVSTPWL